MLNHVALVQLQELLQTVVLPGLQLVPANAAVTTEVWKVLQLLPYRQRFCMYAKWQVCLLTSQLRFTQRCCSKHESTGGSR